MTSPRFKNVFLNVLALDGKDVREIDQHGSPLMAIGAVRIVGKTRQIIDGKAVGIVEEHGVRIPYHAHYISKLKEGSLLPMDSNTAKLAGVPFLQEKTIKL